MLSHHLKTMSRKTGLCGNAGVHRQDLRWILSAERLDKRAADTLAGTIRLDEQQIDMRPDGGDKANRLAVDYGHQAD
ncbi:hypothetical protein NUBL21990_47400 [Klebsiella pneumoniae]|nr:hypothetical protein NUBL21990_47400 [Klebsiella pneumoniae]GKN98674.1 hypothetical protein MS5797_37260 [Klebsiella pneumoniae]